MKKILTPLLLTLTIVQFISCKDEEVPPPATLTFASEFTVAKENEGTVLITLNLDKAAYRDLLSLILRLRDQHS